MREFLRIAACLSLALLAFAMSSRVIAEDHIPINDLKAVEQKLSEADGAWLGGDAGEAIDAFKVESQGGNAKLTFKIFEMDSIWK